MMSSILSNANIGSGLAYILSKINYTKLRTQLRFAGTHADEDHTIVLFEYIHSSVYDTIAQFERIPGTVKIIQNFLDRTDVKDALKSIFVSGENMKIYTRRKREYKNDGSFDLLKERQLVLHISAELPSLISPPADPWGTSYVAPLD